MTLKNNLTNLSASQSGERAKQKNIRGLKAGKGDLQKEETKGKPLETYNLLLMVIILVLVIVIK